MKPWRTLAVPHADVLAGTSMQADFAADISQVHAGVAPAVSTRTPEQFFARTFITEGMRLLLQRWPSGSTGGAVTRSSSSRRPLAAARPTRCWRCTTWPAASAPTEKLAGIPPILDAAGVALLPQARVAVIDGIKLSPSMPRSHAGTTVNTLWGELAVQLLGAEGYALLADADPGRHIARQRRC